MANKTYNVTQKVTINGAKRSTSFSFYGEEADLTAFLALLEGGYSVTERNDTLTDLSHEDTNVTSYVRSSRITMSAKDANGEFLGASIRPYQGSIYFKDTTSSNDLKSALATIKPFKHAPTVVPAHWNSGFTEDA